VGKNQLKIPTSHPTTKESLSLSPTNKEIVEADTTNDKEQERRKNKKNEEVIQITPYPPSVLLIQPQHDDVTLKGKGDGDCPTLPALPPLRANESLIFKVHSHNLAEWRRKE
jgi:hypothetical protein